MKLSYWYIALFVIIVMGIAVAIHPSQIRTGWVFYKSRQYDEAIKKLHDAYVKNPKNYRVLKRYAEAMEVMGDSDEAAKMYEKILTLRPNDKNFENTYRFYMWTLQPERGKETLEKWFEWRQEQPVILFKGVEEKELMQNLYSHYLLSKEFKNAAKIYEKLMDHLDDQYNAELELINIYEKTGNLDKTVELLEKFLKKHPYEPVAISKLVNLAVVADRVDEARKYLVMNVNGNPKDRYNWERLIYFETRMGDMEEANRWFQVWMDKYPDDKSIQKSYVNWMLGTGQEEEAIAYIENLLEGNKELDPFYFNTLVDLYEWTGKYAKLIPIYMERFEEDPTNLVNNKKLLGALFELKDYTLAENVLIKLLSLYPDSKEYVVLMADIYDYRKETEKLIALLSNFYKNHKDSEIGKRLVELYLFNGQPGEAYDILTANMEGFKNDPDTYRFLGDIEADRNNTEKAAGYYKTYIEMRPNDYYGYFRLGEIYFADGNKKLAKENLEKANTLLAGAGENLETNIIKTRMLALLGNTEEALARFEALYASYPDNRDIAYPYIDTLIESKNFNAAEIVTEKFARLYPEDKNINRFRTRVYVGEKRYGEAEELLTTLIAEHPEDNNLKLELAYLYNDMGDWYRAYPMFVELAKEYPQDTGIRDVRDELFIRYRPHLKLGYNLTKTGGEYIGGPYLQFYYPIDSRWTFNAQYFIDRGTTNVPADPDYLTYINNVEAMISYKPIRTMELTAGMLNQFEGADYAPAPRALIDWEDPVYGHAWLDFYYNKVLTDPPQSPYYDTRQDHVGIDYEKIFIERVAVRAYYRSNWYRLNSSKTPTNQGDDFGREDIAGAGAVVFILKKPQVRLGYDFHYSKLHMVNNYIDIIPLIQESTRSDILFGFYHEWNKYLMTDLGGFLGDDPKRDLKLSKMQLWGFNITQLVRPHKRFDIIGHYEFSNESLTGATGRYYFFFLELLYRF